MFNNQNRISSDLYDTTNKNICNSKAGNYILYNHRNELPLTRTINLATQQQNLFFVGGAEGGPGGAHIDENTLLKFSNGTKGRERVCLQQRLFSTVPYLGKGPTNPVLEAQIQQGDQMINRKSVDPNSEVTHIDYIYTPLIPSLEATLTNPANQIEAIAAKGWIRGGLPSREFTKEGDYIQSHTQHQYS